MICASILYPFLDHLQTAILDKFNLFLNKFNFEPAFFIAKKKSESWQFHSINKK